MRPVLIAVVAVVFAARASAACLPVIEVYPIEPLKPGGEWVDLYGSAFGCAPLPQFARIVADPPYLTPGGGVFGPWTEPAQIPVSGPDSAVRFRLFTDIPRTVRFVWSDSVETRVLQIRVRARIDLKRLAPGVLHGPSASCLERTTSTSASSAGTRRLCASYCRPQRSSAAGRPASVIRLRRRPPVVRLRAGMPAARSWSGASAATRLPRR